MVKKVVKKKKNIKGDKISKKQVVKKVVKKKAGKEIVKEVFKDGLTKIQIKKKLKNFKNKKIIGEKAIIFLFLKFFNFFLI